MVEVRNVGQALFSGTGCLSVLAAWVAIPITLGIGWLQYSEMHAQRLDDQKQDLVNSAEQTRQFELLLEKQRELVDQQTRLVNESIKSWDRDFKEKTAPLLLFKKERATVLLGQEARTRRFVPQFVSANSKMRPPTIVNIGQGPAVRPSAYWEYGYSYVDRTSTGSIVDGWEPDFPDDILSTNEEIEVSWVPGIIAADSRREIVSIFGTVTVNCSGKQSQCVQYDFIARPVYNQVPVRIEFEFSNRRPGPCVPLPLRSEPEPTVAPPSAEGTIPTAPLGPTSLKSYRRKYAFPQTRLYG